MKKKKGKNEKNENNEKIEKINEKMEKCKNGKTRKMKNAKYSNMSKVFGITRKILDGFAVVVVKNFDDIHDEDTTVTWLRGLRPSRQPGIWNVGPTRWVLTNRVCRTLCPKETRCGS